MILHFIAYKRAPTRSNTRRQSSFERHLIMVGKLCPIVLRNSTPPDGIKQLSIISLIPFNRRSARPDWGYAQVVRGISAATDRLIQDVQLCQPLQPSRNIDENLTFRNSLPLLDEVHPSL
jgi:hypothetical protein